jgi:AraC family transcriptional regulator
MKNEYVPERVAVVEFPATRVATLEHRGDPRRLGASIRQFIAWRREAGLPPRRSATFNIVYDDERVPADEFRFDLCAATNAEIADNRYGVVAKTIPGGRCALLRHYGSDDTLPATVAYLCGEWLPGSGEEPRDFPLFFERVELFPDVPEHEAVTDVYLPLKRSEPG